MKPGLTSTRNTTPLRSQHENRTSDHGNSPQRASARGRTTDSGSAANCKIVSLSRDTRKEGSSTEQKADAAVRPQHLPRQGLGEEPVVGLRLEGRREQCTARSEGLGAGEKAAPEKAAATSALPHTYSQELGKPHVTTSS